MVSHFWRGLTNEEKSALISKTMRLYTFGTIHYKDAFKKSRVTNFRLALQVDANLNPIALETCERGNTAT